MASLRALLQLPQGWKIRNQQNTPNGILIDLDKCGASAHCTKCKRKSKSVHSYRKRRLQHAPCAGQAVYLTFNIRHWYCRNSSCEKTIFADSLAPFADPKQQATNLLQKQQRQLGLIAGGEAGKRAATSTGISTSSDTILRHIIFSPESEPIKTPHIGIDEWAWQRGHTYGTLIINLDTHRPLTVLPGRDRVALTKWFKQRPEIQVVSRDRGGVYAVAARDGAPQARQIADRWHLLKNIGDALERMMYKHTPLIKEVADESALSQKTQVSNLVPKSRTLTRQESIQQQKRQNRYDKWMEVISLHEQGFGFQSIARKMGMSRVTIKRWVQSKEYPEQSTRMRKTPLPITPWLEWIEEQWNNGQHNASQLWREMVADGFSGSVITVRRNVVRLREGLSLKVTPSARVPSASKVSRWLTPWRILKSEDAYANRFVYFLCKKEPKIEKAKQLAQEFYQMLKVKNESQLDDWFFRVAQSDLTELKRVAVSMARDEAAVRAAISSKWSNGVVEGHVNRLKMLKRQMYGRAGFELLRRRVMSPLA